MANKNSFVPEEVYQLAPITEGDQQYGLTIAKFYSKSMGGVFDDLFLHGITGMICAERDPKSVEFIHKLLASQAFVRPEDYSNVNSMRMSNGYHISAKFDFRFLSENLRWYKCIRLQGDYEKLIGIDYPNEGTGTMAVCLAGNLALCGVMPIKKHNSIIIREMKIASMHPDKEHEKSWLAAEFDLYIHNYAFSTIGLPRDRKTGYVPLDSLEKAASEVV